MSPPRHSEPPNPPGNPRRKGNQRPGSRRRRAPALALSGALGVAAALLVSCGSSGKLIPVANSEPLQADFEEVARDAEAAHGDCGATEASVRKAINVLLQADPKRPHLAVRTDGGFSVLREM